MTIIRGWVFRSLTGCFAASVGMSSYFAYRWRVCEDEAFQQSLSHRSLNSPLPFSNVKGVRSRAVEDCFTACVPPADYVAGGSSLDSGNMSAVVNVLEPNGAFDAARFHNAARDDGLGGHIHTYYNEANTLREPTEAHPPLTTHRADTVDVCVIGGGFAGLHAALSLAERGKKVVLLEGNRIGSGASGRNGGQALSGFETPTDEIVSMVGEDAAKEICGHNISGYERLKTLIRRYKIACDANECGVYTLAFASRFKSEASVAAEVEEVTNDTVQSNALFGDVVQVCDKAELHRRGIHSERFAYGLFNPRSVTVNPLALCLGLARACTESRNVHIYESSPVVSFERQAVSIGSEAPRGVWRALADACFGRGDESLVLEMRRGLKEGLSLYLREAARLGTPVAGGVRLHRSLGPENPLWWWVPSHEDILQCQRALGRSMVKTCAPSSGTLSPSGRLEDFCAACHDEFLRQSATVSKYGGGDWVIRTPTGSLRAREIILATNAAPFSLSPALSISTLSTSTAIMLTPPIPVDVWKETLQTRSGIIDERFALSYFRRVSGNRLLFGGLGTTAPVHLPHAAEELRRDLVKTFPQLEPYLTKAELVWQGRIESRSSLFPLVGRDQSSGLWYSLGFSGHGLVPTCAAGELLASAISSIPDVRAQVATSARDGHVPAVRELLEPADTRFSLWTDVDIGHCLPQCGQSSIFASFPPAGLPGSGLIQFLALEWMPSFTDWFNRKY